ncbi:MAG: dihydrodipicolinate synthase family protein [Verrucomicrobiota bacterium]
MKHLSGLIAAPHTPFRSDGTVALDLIPQQARLLAHNKVAGAFICGTTGEGPSLSGDERRKVAEAWLAARPKGLSVIVHVGHLCLADARAYAAHAQEIGADAIATVAPSFFKPAAQPELVAWCAQVAAAAPKLPFYYYTIPSMTSVALSSADFVAAAESQIPTLAGVKFTYENLMDFQRATAHGNGKYNILFGRDEILLAGLGLGAKGAVGSTYNFAAPLYNRVIDAFNRGDFESARRDQNRAIDFITVLDRHGGLAAGKAVMKLIGLDCGPVRLPLRALTERDEASLRDGLERVGFFEYCCKLP